VCDTYTSPAAGCRGKAELMCCDGSRPTAYKHRYDDEIFEHTLREFPEFADAPHTGLVTLDEGWMKSNEGKERWRTFINAYVSPPSPCPAHVQQAEMWATQL
jgi:hypothetical protein